MAAAGSARKIICCLLITVTWFSATLAKSGNLSVYRRRLVEVFFLYDVFTVWNCTIARHRPNFKIWSKVRYFGVFFDPHGHGI